MVVSELIALLQDFDGDTEVRLAIQPSWPFEHRVGQVALVAGLDGEGDADIVYIGEGEQLGYLAQEAAFCLGW